MEMLEGAAWLFFAAALFGGAFQAGRAYERERRG